MQYTYNVILWRVRAAIVTTERNNYIHFVCGLRYPACKAHAPYCHLWPVRFYNSFF